MNDPKDEFIKKCKDLEKELMPLIKELFGKYDSKVVMCVLCYCIGDLFSKRPDYRQCVDICVDFLQVQYYKNMKKKENEK